MNIIPIVSVVAFGKIGFTIFEVLIPFALQGQNYSRKKERLSLRFILNEYHNYDNLLPEEKTLLDTTFEKIISI